MLPACAFTFGIGLKAISHGRTQNFAESAHRSLRQGPAETPVRIAGDRHAAKKCSTNNESSFAHAVPDCELLMRGRTCGNKAITHANHPQFPESGVKVSPDQHHPATHCADKNSTESMPNWHNRLDRERATIDVIAEKKIVGVRDLGMAFAYGSDQGATIRVTIRVIYYYMVTIWVL